MHKRIPWLLMTSLAACSYADLVPRTVDDDGALPALEISGTRLHLETFGNPADPVVITLHGGPGADYRSLLPLRALADEGYFVVFWDQRSAGLSSRQQCDGITPDAYLRDLEAIVDRFARSGTDRVSFIGHSWGAMYATWYVNEHPERVGAMVLAEPGGFTRAELDAYLDRWLGSASLTGEPLNDAAFLGRMMTTDDQERLDYQVAQRAPIVEESLGQDTVHPEPFWRYGALASECLIDSARAFDWTTDLSRYTREVLFLHGARNTVHTLEHQTALAAHYPHARVVTLEGVGHDIFSAAPEQALQLIRAQLAAFQVQP
jgi:proline iminopeptidase